MRNSLCGFSSTAWRGIRHSSVRVIKLDFILTGFRVQCFSTRRVRASRLPKVNPVPSMEQESDAFYVVRKGDIIGVYRSLSDCQAQVSSSVCDPPVSVYKGYSLCKETEQYLASRGLKDALYSMNAVDVKEDLFGTLVPCPFQQPDGLVFSVDKSPKQTSLQKRSIEIQPDGLDFLVDKAPQKTSPQKRSTEIVNIPEAIGSSSILAGQSKKHPKLGHTIEARPTRQNYMTCILEFDGASKGNPGKSGAGAILRTEDGSVISRLREGLGVVTNNVAEYRALLLGLKSALKKGFKEIRVQGDSKLVCMQVNDLWQTKNQNMADLCREVKKLKDEFLSFKIGHVMREFNSDADAQANLAVDLPIGQVFEESGELY